MGIFRSGDEKEIVAEARGDSITEDRLFNKSARVLKRLNTKPIVEYLESEQPHYLFKNAKSGLDIVSPKEDESIEPDGPYHAYCLFTDQGVTVLVGQKSGDKVIRLGLDEIWNVSFGTRLSKYEIRLSLIDGTAKFVAVKSTKKDELKEAVEYINQHLPDDREEVNPRPDLTGVDPDAELKITASDSSEESERKDPEKLAKQANSDTVTSDRLTSRQGLILEKLGKDEQPHYILKGNPLYGIKIEGGTSVDDQSAGLTSPLKTAAIRDIITVLTDQRVLLLVVKTGGTNSWTVPYDSIVGVDRQEKVSGFPLVLQTNGRTYYADISEASNDPGGVEILQESEDFIRNKINETSQPSSENDNDVPPIEQLERLKDLHDKGALSDEEFEDKKTDLLDKI